MALSIDRNARAGKHERMGNWLRIINDQQNTNLILAICSEFQTTDGSISVRLLHAARKAWPQIIEAERRFCRGISLDNLHFCIRKRPVREQWTDQPTSASYKEYVVEHNDPEVSNGGM